MNFKSLTREEIKKMTDPFVSVRLHAIERLTDQTLAQKLLAEIAENQFDRTNDFTDDYGFYRARSTAIKKLTKPSLLKDILIGSDENSKFGNDRFSYDLRDEARERLTELQGN